MMNKVLWVLFFVSLFGAFSLRQQVIDLKKEKAVYENNTAGLLTDLEILKDDSTEQAHQIQTLTLTVDEYQKHRAEDLQTIKDLKIKLKNVEAASRQEYEVHASIEAPVKEVIVKDSIKTDTIQHIHLANPYITFNAQLYTDTLKADIQVPIEVLQVVHKVPKHKFLWWTWGCKGFKQVIVTNNPYVKLKYAEFIELR